MNFFLLIKELFLKTDEIDIKLKNCFRFSQKEIAEIMSICKKENVKYFERLAKIPNLKAFDISYLLSEVELNENKIEIIEQAQKLYNEEEFLSSGQSQSDFIFRVAVNLDYINLNNINFFKELVKCKNEVYDFKKIFENHSICIENHTHNKEFAFEKILID